MFQKVKSSIPPEIQGFKFFENSFHSNPGTLDRWNPLIKLVLK